MTSPAHSISNTPIGDDAPRFPSFVHCLESAAQTAPDRIAIICEENKLSYAAYARGAAGLASRLVENISHGDRVIVMMGNSIECAIGIAGAMAAGAQATLVNAFFTKRELTTIFEIADASALICNTQSQEKATELARDAGIENIITLDLADGVLPGWLADDTMALSNTPMPNADDLALLLFTGGTTGVPKGVNHAHGPLAFSMLQHCAMWPLDFDRERFLTVAPMFHIWGLTNATWIPVYTRGTLVIIPQYHPETVLRAFENNEITVFAGGPAPIYAGLLAHPLIPDIRFHSLKYAYSGGAPCSETLHTEWEEVTGCGIYEGYGMTESAPIALNPAWGERRLMSVGLPVPQTEIQIVDVETGTRVLETGENGEVRIRGPQCTSGYRNNPEETAILLRDGWLHTGDIGFIAEDGYLSIVDRKKEMVIVGGYNVYPREVDDVLASHPDVAEAATIGRPDEFLGEVIVAWVAVKKGAELSDTELDTWCKEKLVKYKRPVEFFHIDALPRTAARKIDKLALKKMLLEDRPDHIV